MRLTETIRHTFVSGVMQDVPRVDYTEQVRSILQKDSVEQLPREIQPAAKDPKLSPYLNTARHHVPNFGMFSVFSADRDYRPTPATLKKLQELSDAQKEQRMRHDALEEKLMSAARGARTRKQLVELLPEFEKYLPADEAACSTLPSVANVVSAFVSAGWPKQKQDQK